MDQFVSYAQNFEDVMLWRALKNVDRGFYVDVGAFDPIIASVTQAFYERGWHGINIEPLPAGYERLCKERIHDINLLVAAGSNESELTLFALPDTGDSSVVPELAEKYRSAGRTVIEHKVKVKTLNQIFEEQKCREIHFLKIDVEGYEKPVLEGLDLHRWRPWILVIESTKPNSPEQNFNVWESLVLSANYSYVYFDGLNRFYVAEEHSELIQSFYAPPNLFDNLILYSQVKKDLHIRQLSDQLNQSSDQVTKQSTLNDTLRNDLETLRSDLEWVRKDRGSTTAELEWTRGELMILRKETETSNKELISLMAQLTQKQAETIAVQAKLGTLQLEIEASKQEQNQLASQLHHIEQELEIEHKNAEDLRHQYINVLYSKSYRVTAPLRGFYNFFANVKKSVSRIFTVSTLERKDREENSTASALEASVGAISEKETHFKNLFQRELNRRSGTTSESFK